jgi:TatD DNase family protein
MLVDSHCHLDMLAPVKAGAGVDAVLRVAREAGVSGFLCVGVHPDAQAAMLELVGERPGVWCSAGVHPSSALESEPDVATIVGWCRDPRIIAVGETGLDYHYVDAVAPERQRERFRNQVRAARETGLPLIIHTREARADTLAILREERADEVGGVFHCFTEDRDTALAAIDLGFRISFSGILTFRNAEPLRQLARELPLESLLVETDAPYLAPVPMRGRENKPAFVRHVAQCIAGERGVGFETVAAATTANFHRTFARAGGGLHKA